MVFAVLVTLFAPVAVLAVALSLWAAFVCLEPVWKGWRERRARRRSCRIS
ncbi:MAG TPA: hypothetical protein VN436_03735 [Holophaga sp.]|nr:hypothetical protein [Holophaga sp.]